MGNAGGSLDFLGEFAKDWTSGWGVVQLVERLVLVQDVEGSSPSSPANRIPGMLSTYTFSVVFFDVSAWNPPFRTFPQGTGE